MSNSVMASHSASNTSHRILYWWMQISAILLILVELIWILSWFMMITQITSTAPWWIAGATLGGVMLTSYAVGYWMESLRLLRNLQLILMAALLVFGLLISENLLLQQPIRTVAGGLVMLNPGAILVLFFVIWMWWRGLSLSRGHIRPMIAWRRFELGLLFFMSYIFIASRLGFALPSLGIFFLFLFSGLMGVVFARISYVGIVKGAEKNPFDLRWSISVSTILGITVTLAVLIGGLFSGQYKMVLDFLAEGIKLLIAIVIFIAGIPGLLVSIAFAPLLPWLKSLFGQRPDASEPDQSVEALRQLIPWEEQVPNLSITIQTLCFWLLIVGVLVLLILKIKKNLGEKRMIESLGPESLLKQGEARKLLQKTLEDAMTGLIMRLRPTRRIIAAARVRRIYSQLLDLSEELGHPRHPHRTPLEFLPEMGELFTAQLRELNVITDAYQRVRYGEYPEEVAQLDAIEFAWGKISEEGQRLKRAGLGKLKIAEVKEVERTGV